MVLYRNSDNQRGEISTIFILGALGLITLGAIITNLINKNNSQDIRSHAATDSNCIKIVDIKDPGILTPGQQFWCQVTIDGAYADSQNVACGWSRNGGWPQTGGYWWEGANCTGTNCTFGIKMDNPINPADTYELVAFDFRIAPNIPQCGPQTGIRIPIKYSFNSSNTDPLKPPGQPISTPIPPTPTTNPIAYQGTNDPCSAQAWDNARLKHDNQQISDADFYAFLDYCAGFYCKKPGLQSCLWIPKIISEPVKGGKSKSSPTQSPGQPTSTIKPNPKPNEPNSILQSIKHYSQCDSTWASYPPSYIQCEYTSAALIPTPGGPTPLPVTMFLGNSGCGPASTAMILATVFNKTTNYLPTDQWDEYNSQGRMKCWRSNEGIGKGTTGADVRTTLINHGLNAELKAIYDQNDQISVYKDMLGYLNAGYYIIALTNQYGGHFLVVNSIQTDGKDYIINVHDPYAGCDIVQPATGVTKLPKDASFIYGFTVIKKV